MSILIKGASSNAVVTTGWTNPINAQATNPDNVYATAEPAVSSDVISDFIFSAVTDGEIPPGSTINSVKIVIDSITAVLTGATIGFQGYNNGVADGSENGNPTGGSGRSTFTFTTIPSITDLKTASRLKARVRVSKGSTAGTINARLDMVSMVVDFTPPAQLGWTIAFTADLGPNNGTTHTGRTIVIPTLQVGDAIFVAIQRGATANDLASDTISDSVGNDYTTHRASGWSSLDNQGCIFVATVATVGGTNVNLTSVYNGGAKDYDSLRVVVARNSLGAISLDQFNVGAVATTSGAGPDTATSASLTPAAANSLIFGGFEFIGGGNTVLPGTSPNAFTPDQMTQGAGLSPGGEGTIEHFVYSGTAAIAATASMQASGLRYVPAIAIFKYATAGPTQFSRPSADVAVGGWVPTPGTPTTLFDKLDETTPSDTDYISATST
jgi:hypothetical protein